MGLFFLAAFLMDVSLGAILLCVPLFAISKFNVAPLFLGYIGSIGALFYFFSVLAFGRLSDRFNRKMVLLGGCLLFGLTYSIMPLVKVKEQILFFYPLGSLGMAMFWPSIQSWLAEGLDKKTLSKSLGIFNISWSMGLMTGPLVGGFLFQIDYRLPFWFGVLLAFSVIILLLRQPCLSSRRPQRLSNPSAILELRIESEGKFGEFLYVAWIANLASWFFIGIIRNLFPKLAIHLQIEPKLIGILVFLMGLAQGTIFIILSRTEAWHYRFFPIFLLQILGCFGLLLILNFSSVLIFGLALLSLGFCSGLTYFASLFYSLYGRPDKGTKSGLHEGFIGAGCLLGPLAGGTLAQQFGLRAPYLLASMVVILAIALETVIVLRAKCQS